MVVVPSPCERVVSDVVFRARRSSSSSLRRSWSSPTSGATTSRIRPPRTRSSCGVNVAACSTSTFSALTRMSAAVSSGRSSNARAITSACAVDTSPVACPSARIVHRCSRERASVMSRRAGPRSARTVRPNHAATSRSPDSSATSSATAISRNRTDVTRDSSRASSTNAAAFSAGARYRSSTWPTLSSAAQIASPHSWTRCPVVISTPRGCEPHASRRRLGRLHPSLVEHMFDTIPTIGDIAMSCLKTSVTVLRQDIGDTSDGLGGDTSVLRLG